MKNKDKKAFADLLEKHQNIVHKVCHIYADDEATRKDLFQEIAIQLWKSYPSFRGDSKFSTWMYRVALNTAISLYRKSKRRVATQRYDQIEFKVKAEEYDTSVDENVALLYQAIKELNDIDKALVLMYLEERQYSEIAETLGISQVNARVKMNRVKKKLRKILSS